MYYIYGVLGSSLVIESVDSMIHTCDRKGMVAEFFSTTRNRVTVLKLDTVILQSLLYTY